jgi:hypothetical protein
MGFPEKAIGCAGGAQNNPFNVPQNVPTGISPGRKRMDHSAYLIT